MRVWDPVVRTIHWAVAALVLVDLLNEAGANPWHRSIGYAAAALVAARLASGPRRRLASMVFTLWTLVLLAGLTGWMLGLDAFWGEQWLQNAHAAIAYLLAACVVVHVTDVIVTSRARRVVPQP